MPAPTSGAYSSVCTAKKQSWFPQEVLYGELVAIATVLLYCEACEGDERVAMETCKTGRDLFVRENDRKGAQSVVRAYPQ